MWFERMYLSCGHLLEFQCPILQLARTHPVAVGLFLSFAGHRHRLVNKIIGFSDVFNEHFIVHGLHGRSHIVNTSTLHIHNYAEIQCSLANAHRHTHIRLQLTASIVWIYFTRHIFSCRHSNPYANHNYLRSFQRPVCQLNIPIVRFEVLPFFPPIFPSESSIRLFIAGSGLNCVTRATVKLAK